MITKISGASDDLICVDGDISDEIGCFASGPRGINIFCSDGTKAVIKYNGEWNIDVKEAGTGYVKRVTCGGGGYFVHTEDHTKGCSNYSDVLVMKDIAWVKIGRKLLKK